MAVVCCGCISVRVRTRLRTARHAAALDAGETLSDTSPHVASLRTGNTVKPLCSRIADRMGLVESRDYERVCLGEAGFAYMIEALAGENTTFGACDIGASSITASTERAARGIRFSRATHRSALAVLIHAPLKKRGMWAFFEPLHLYVWMALLGTIFATPFFVFFFEAVFSKWCATSPAVRRCVYTAARAGRELHMPQRTPAPQTPARVPASTTLGPCRRLIVCRVA